MAETTSAAVFFVLFFGPLGAAPESMNMALYLGPFDTAATCYAAGALSLDNLNSKHPDRDFRGSCVTGDPAHADPAASLDLHQLAAKVTDDR